METDLLLRHPRQCNMKKKTNFELKVIFWIIVLLFGLFLAAPLLILLKKSMTGEQGITLEFYRSVLLGKDFLPALCHSFLVAAAAAVTATILAFLAAYTVHYTNTPRWLKQVIKAAASLPMFLPTITYGFAIIYSFGKQGLITRILGKQLFDIYGFMGLMVGYVIYTIPVAFLLIHNTMEYIDKKTLIVSKVMGDGNLSTFWISILRPLLGTLAGAFVQAFFLSFTDFGIPASVGGSYDVIATTLYNRISDVDLRRNSIRDISWGTTGFILSILILSVFAVIFTVPMVEEWPYKTGFSLEHFQNILADSELLGAYTHSIIMAVCTALFGTLLSYGAALITARSTLSNHYKRTIDSISLVTNAIPGMVLGVSYLFLFPGTPLQNTLTLMVLCNMIHYFSTPYLMMKNSLSKMNAGWETTAMLMGDSWIKTIIRVVTPNALSSLLEAFSYYFINAMVTISALVFIAGARTMVLTTKIKQLQYINKFNEIFVLSLLILITNLAAKLLFSLLAKKLAKRKNTM